jgi:hypothetical protein
MPLVPTPRQADFLALTCVRPCTAALLAAEKAKPC